MGTYNIGINEFAEKFEDFLRDLEGDISAETVSIIWNNLARKYKWNDKLIPAYNTKTFKSTRNKFKGEKNE